MKKPIISSVLSVILAALALTSNAQTSFVSISDPKGVTTVYVGANDGVA